MYKFQTELELRPPNYEYSIESLYWEVVEMLQDKEYQPKIAWQCENEFKNLVGRDPGKLSLLLKILETYEEPANRIVVSEGKINLKHCSGMPPGEIHFVDRGKTIGKIINIDTKDKSNQ